MVNRADARFCLRCGDPLDAAAVLELKARDEESQRLMSAVFDPSVDPKIAEAQTQLIERKVSEILFGNVDFRRAYEEQIAKRRVATPPRRRRPMSGDGP